MINYGAMKCFVKVCVPRVTFTVYKTQLLNESEHYFFLNVLRLGFRGKLRKLDKQNVG